MQRPDKRWAAREAHSSLNTRNLHSRLIRSILLSLCPEQPAFSSSRCLEVLGLPASCYTLRTRSQLRILKVKIGDARRAATAWKKWARRLGRKVLLEKRQSAFVFSPSLSVFMHTYVCAFPSADILKSEKVKWH